MSAEAERLLDQIRRLVEETDRLRWQLAEVAKRDAQALASGFRVTQHSSSTRIRTSVDVERDAKSRPENTWPAACR